MFNDLKLAFQSFKRNYQDYLAISFVFGTIIFIGFLLGYFFIGVLFAYIAVMIPAIISLKFCVFQSYNKEQVEYKSLKIGFLTFFKSIKVYSMVVLKPILIGLLVGVMVYSVFLSNAINVASEFIPNLMEALQNYDTFQYTYKEMLEINDVSKILDVGLIVSILVAYIVYFSIKLKRDFIPFVAFEMPITSKRAIDINKRVLKNQYFKFFLNSFIIVLIALIPVGLSIGSAKLLSLNKTFSETTIILVSALILCITIAPVALIKQLHYVYAYKSHSKPFKEDFDNELKNVIKEIEELQKIINKKDEK